MLETMLSDLNESLRQEGAKYNEENSVIASSVQKGSYIYIYSPKGNMIGGISGYELVGFTSTTVTARAPHDKHSHYIFDAKGNLKTSFNI